MDIKPLIRGECPICKKIIMNQKKTSYINGGMDFWVQFSDSTRAIFAICQDCYKNITQEQLDGIMQSQIVSWGDDIQKQLLWYINKAIFLRIDKHAKDKDGL